MENPFKFHVFLFLINRILFYNGKYIFILYFIIIMILRSFNIIHIDNY